MQNTKMDFVKVKNLINDYSLDLSLFDICFVDIPNLISKNMFSYVQTRQFNFNANATDSTSLMCSLNNCLASEINPLYSLNETTFINPNSNDTNSSNSVSDSLDFESISSLLLTNSSFNFSGANSSRFLSNIKFTIVPCEIKVLNNTLESITTLNYISPDSFNFLCIDSLTFLESKSASFSVNLDLDTISLNLFNISTRLISLTNSSLVSSDQFAQDNFFISDLISSGIANVNDTIYISPLSTSLSNSFNCLTLRITILLNISDHFTSGNSSIRFFNSPDIESVMVAILLNYVYIRKYVQYLKLSKNQKEVKNAKHQNGFCKS